MQDQRYEPATSTDVACSLAANELTDRTAQWRQVAARALTRSVQPGRVSSVYPRDPDLMQRLADLIEAESDCCSFLEFTVRDDGEVVHVDLDYPRGFEGLLGSVLGAA